MDDRPPPFLQKTIMHFVLFFLISLLVVAVIHLGKTVIDNYRYTAEKEMWIARIEHEKAETQRLIALKEFVQSDTYQRKLAHELGLYGPDEQPLILVLPPEMQQEINSFNATVREEKIPEPPYWKQWWELFFGPMES